MVHVDVKNLISRVVKGEEASSVVASLASPQTESIITEVKGKRLMCVKCSTEYPYTEEQMVCPSCGLSLAQITASAHPVEIRGEGIDSGGLELISRSTPIFLIPAPLPDESPETRQYSLADLRPQDRFIFIRLVPHVELDLGTEYQVIPARRGAVSFSDQTRRTYSVSLIAAHLYPIKLMSEDTVDPGQRFYPADRVRHKTLRWKGIVLNYHGMGYYVRPVSEDGDEDDGRGAQWVAGSELRLIDKLQTTRGYVRTEQTPKGTQFRVRYGGELDASSPENTLSDALRLLFNKNRVAFNRFSKWLSDPSPDNDMLQFVDVDARRFLQKVDSMCWKDALER